MWHYQDKVHELVKDDNILAARFYSTLCQVPGTETHAAMRCEINSFQHDLYQECGCLPLISQCAQPCVRFLLENQTLPYALTPPSLCLFLSVCLRP